MRSLYAGEQGSERGRRVTGRGEGKGVLDWKRRAMRSIRFINGFKELRNSEFGGGIGRSIIEEFFVVTTIWEKGNGRA